jgi:pSer/pThr/pTyr-binding forkhead associated (FHA) protein
MFLELKVLHPEGTNRSVVVATGQTVQIGRLKHTNQLAMPDPVMAPVHFSVACEGNQGRLRDLNLGVQKHVACEAECFVAALRNAKCAGGCRLNDRSGEMGVYLNGGKVREAVLQNGDTIVSGSSAFTVALTEEPPLLATTAPMEATLTLEQQARALDYFARQKLPLFALLDAARAPGVLEALRVHSEIHYSLYDGAEGESLDEVAPYLVQLNARSPLTELLVRQHWGQSWGIFLWALTDFKSLRRQLRRFLIVQDAKRKDMYFRFYDPRVLRVFLPTCTPDELSDFFGPIASFLIEAAEPAHAWSCSREPGYPLRLENLAF